MKTASTSILHKIENQFGLILSSIDAMEANIENTEYCLEVIKEIKNKKDKLSITIDELKKVVGSIE